ncbi:MAG: hypothetical protein U5Q44_12400 [Dehalococcoidia bacterium]|nr:hypothetical protein [Dehalococcoidia bacterium]
MDQGESTGTPQRSKSRTLRVTTVRSCARAVAAIEESMSGTGWPAFSSRAAETSPRSELPGGPNGRMTFEHALAEGRLDQAAQLGARR